MFMKPFSRLVLEVFVSTAVFKVVGDTIRRNVIAQTTLQKVLRLTGEIVIVSIITDYSLNYVDKRVTDFRAWWEKRKNNAQTTE